MEKKRTKNPLRFAILLILFVALPFAKHRLRNHARDYINQQLPHQVTQQELDYAALIEAKTGKNIFVYSINEYDEINGTPDFTMVVFAIGEKDAYTDIGCAIFDKKEINRQVLFMNVVSGYENILDKVVYSVHNYDDNENFSLCSFDTLAYDNWTFNPPTYVLLQNGDISRVELFLNGGETVICEKLHIDGVYEIEPNYWYSLDTINFYDSDGNTIAVYIK
ncbi:MAG: hypothetical protein E7484_05140 [Ruminococcaceae bacterium]|nr:hypothetical protein [Oscillospiraceae bacterium]